ncbi:MAG: hypothetical protein ACI4Q4_03475 [Oscillospiraceae bacterium]
MTEKARRNLLHFVTDGEDIKSDFLEARAQKNSALRRRANLCFYIHAGASAGCIIAALTLGICAGSIAASIAAAVTALLAFLMLVRTPAARLVLFALDVLCAAGCVCFGAAEHCAAYFVCAAFMLAAAASTLCGYFASVKRKFLNEFDPDRLTPDDYVTIRRFAEPPARKEHDEPVISAPPPPKKSEMQLLAEQLCEILNRKPEPSEADLPQGAAQKTEEQNEA